MAGKKQKFSKEEDELNAKFVKLAMKGKGKVVVKEKAKKAK
ncbi:MAG TPA: hypothetical protein VNM69_15325 [Bacillus sp. (in: firmicutes)]|nr:hypothetical protein [Bacillus sp. (in: firmicutes)]